LFDALINAGVELRPIAVNQNPISWKRRIPFRPLHGKRFTAEKTNFDGPDNSPPVLAIDLPRGGRIQSGKTAGQFVEGRLLQGLA
jgi:hypothetical protein